MSKEKITERRDLRTGEPLWLHSAGRLVNCRRHPSRHSYDSVIVGAGISGAMLAYALSRMGRSVLVLDRRPPLHGSTAASTAMLLFEIDTPLFELSRRIGHDKAERAWRRSAKAVENLRAVVKDEHIRCGWRDAETLYLAGDTYGRTALRREVEARNAAALSGEYMSASELKEKFGIERTGAILSTGAAHADPVQLAAGLLRRAVARGTEICSPIAVEAVAASRQGATLATTEGIDISAESVVFCTGYEILKPVPDQGQSIKSTWAFASAPEAKAPGWLAERLIWEASDPYVYLRQTPDGRIVAGGEDEPWSKAHADSRLLVAKTDAIAAKVRAMIPGMKFRIAHRWAGAFGDSDTGLPVIGAVLGLPNCYAVAGFGGNGITYSMIAAEIISGLLAGIPDRDADLYRFATA